MKKIIAICIIGLLSLSTFAQADASSVAILEKVSTTYKSSTGSEISMNIVMEDARSGNKNEMKAILRAQGKKFALKGTQATMIFNGKTLYVYTKGTEEVMVSEPIEEDLEQVDPTLFLSSYVTGYKITPPEETKTNYTINLFPEDKDKEYFKIQIVVKKSNYLPKSISTYSKNGLVSTIEIKEIKTNQVFTDNEFVFDAREFPKAEIIDIR